MRQWLCNNNTASPVGKSGFVTLFKIRGKRILKLGKERDFSLPSTPGYHLQCLGCNQLGRKNNMVMLGSRPGPNRGFLDLIVPSIPRPLFPPGL